MCFSSQLSEAVDSTHLCTFAVLTLIYDRVVKVSWNTEHCVDMSLWHPCHCVWYTPVFLAAAVVAAYVMVAAGSHSVANSAA